VTEASPIVSVIMPCFNAALFVRDAVLSVMDQSCREAELIVIDDGSTDDSKIVLVQLLKEFPDRLLLISEDRGGAYHARNRGLSIAKGKYVAFLDADDWWDLDFLAKMLEVLDHEHGADLAYCGWQNIGASDRSNEPFIPPDYEVNDKLALLLKGGSPWPIHAALCRRAVIEAIGGFRTDLGTSHDFELWLRIAVQHRVRRVTEVLAYYRFHGEGQISARPWVQAMNGWRIKRRFLAELDTLDEPTRNRLTRLINRALLDRGYRFYWQRNLQSAQHIFRFALREHLWERNDVRYLLPALIPSLLYRTLVNGSDRLRKRSSE
jgi:glycosyltransferase involved in cell wall biosynthesis